MQTSAEARRTVRHTHLIEPSKRKVERAGSKRKMSNFVREYPKPKAVKYEEPPRPAIPHPANKAQQPELVERKVQELWHFAQWNPSRPAGYTRKQYLRAPKLPKNFLDRNDCCLPEDYDIVIKAVGEAVNIRLQYSDLDEMKKEFRAYLATRHPFDTPTFHGVAAAMRTFMLKEAAGLNLSAPIPAFDLAEVRWRIAYKVVSEVVHLLVEPKARSKPDEAAEPVKTEGSSESEDTESEWEGFSD
ncbi:MAG: hypothetical protein M1831_000006 [Alyxoria varia]|nr:MAG: hypothetical protein M1831_000006 [Alyxoria varia]